MAPTQTPPPKTSSSWILSYPSPYVLLVTINRPKAMNSIPMEEHWIADQIFSWFDAEPELRVAIITGTGTKAFCAGQDLIEQGRWKVSPPPLSGRKHPASGFAGISRRAGRKPIIAAVNGFALGGGFEIVLNCDMVVASPTASFGLPEATVGLYAAAGGLPRLVRQVGMTLASEVAMTGRRLNADEALRFNVINKVSKTPESLVDEAVALAKIVANTSPDGIIITKHGLREAWETGSVERATQRTGERYDAVFATAPNMKIGLDAFAQKKKPNWVPSKI